MNVNRGFNEYSKQLSNFKSLSNSENKGPAPVIEKAETTTEMFDFSATTKQLSQAVTFNQDEKPDLARLHELRQRINQGDYQIDLDKLTDKIMDEIKHSEK